MTVNPSPPRTGIINACGLAVGICSLALVFSLPGSALWGQLPVSNLQTLVGQESGVSLESIDAQGTVQLTTASGSRSLSVDEILKLETGRSVTRSDLPMSVMFVGGGRVFARSVTIAKEVVTLNGSAGSLEMPLETLRAVVWNRSDRVQDALDRPSTEQDTVVVEVNGRQTAVQGLFSQLSDEGLQIDYEGELRTIGADKLQALVMADLGFSPPRGPLATIGLRDGSTWRGVIRGFDGDTLALALTDNRQVDLAADRVATVAIASDRIAYLSGLEPVAVRESTDFVLPRPWQKNRSVGGKPLRIRDSSRESGELRLETGIGVQARSELVFANAGFDRFQCLVGIDLETEGRGDCEVSVRGDGIELWSGRITAAQDPQPIDVEISGIERISLQVRPGREFDLADHVDWGNARFLKTQD